MPIPGPQPPSRQRDKRPKRTAVPGRLDVEAAGLDSGGGGRLDAATDVVGGDDPGEAAVIGYGGTEVDARSDLLLQVRLAWHAKETLRGLYAIDCPQLAERYADELADDLADADCPPELRRLGRTLARWHTPIVNWHRARVSNGPTEAVNNLIKRVKRAAFGFRRFAHYRIRALLYAGKPNWTLLNGLTPR